MSKIAIVGHGNLGSHLAGKFSENHDVTIFTRNPCEGESDLTFLEAADFDFVILTLLDDMIGEFSDKLPKSDAIILHTSGSRPLSDLNMHRKRGVLYPLQTFSKEKNIDFEKVQILVEGTPEIKSEIVKLAMEISNHVKVMNSSDRAKTHLAAVFACNFSNHMYHIAEKQLKEIGMTFRDILPLVNETLEKAIALNPSNAQTGPAVRKDQVTIDRQLEMLNGNEQLLYELITKNIQRYT
ncbi:MAG: DUF2520 domain-containing protein [Ekhidna sp.]|nr:DUF2520 domain-containing protein [Ekhidna sp.]MBC6410885.1 DUF2520 domain-containing protein [Ekhidna sp.]MBC6427455.1 DUF2520 domain-containing protein [Ekhidna sp.]